MDRSSRQKINKETQTLNDTLNNTYRPNCYPQEILSKGSRIHFFSNTHGTFSRVHHILGHKSSLGTFKKIKIISSIFSDHNAMKLDIDYRKTNCKNYKNMNIKPYASK